MEFSQIVDPVFHDSNSFGSMIHGLRCLNVEVQGFDDIGRHFYFLSEYSFKGIVGRSIKPGYLGLNFIKRILPRS